MIASKEEKKMSLAIGRLAHGASVSLGPSPEQLTLQKGLTLSTREKWFHRNKLERTRTIKT